MSADNQRIILVTGSTDGIGLGTVLELSKSPSNTIIIHGRSQEKADKAVQHIKNQLSKQKSIATLDTVVGDLSVMQQVVKMAEDISARFDRLDVLLLNAGVLTPKRSTTVDGLELAFQVNHLSQWVLSQLLLPLLKKSNSGRLIWVSSICHSWHPIIWDDLQSEKDFEKYVQYSRTKLANHLTAFAQARRLEGTNVTCNVLEPGVIQTKLLKAGGFSGAPISDGIVCPVYLCTSAEVESVSGKYFSNTGKVISASADSLNTADQEKLWQISTDMAAKLGVKL